MPVVAGNLPYNPVPTEAPNVQQPSRYQDIQARPESFGAAPGAAESKLGATIGEAGNMLEANALQRQELFNKVAADDATNQYQDKETKLLYGDPNVAGDTGFYGKKGEEALRALPDVRNQLLQLREGLRGGLQNPRQQLEFDAETRRLQAYSLARMGAHYDQEFNTYHEKVNAAKYSNAMGAAATAIANNDDPAFHAEVGKAMRAGIDDLQRQGLGNNEDAVNKVLQKVRTDAVKIKVDTIGAKDPAGALKFLENNKDALAPGEYPALERELRTRAQHQQTVEDAYGAGRNIAPQNTPVPEEYKPLIHDASTKHGVPEELLTKVLDAESSFNPYAVSPTGATGIAQFISSTAKQYGVDRTDSKSSIFGAAQYLSDLHKETGSWIGALEKYLGSDPKQDKSYLAKGATQLAIKLDRGDRPESQGFDVAGGDSIGVGFIRAGKVGGTAVDSVTMPEAALAEAAGSRNPQQALDFVRTHPERFAGKTVLWSSGLMNAGADPSAALPIIRDQLKELKAVGANVVLSGVDKGRFAPYNAELEKIANEVGVPFAGPLPTNNIHPSPAGYRSYAADAVKLINNTGVDTLQKAPDISRPLPAPDPGFLPDGSIPGLSQKIQELDQKIPKDDPERFWRAVNEVRKSFNAQYADKQRVFREHQEQVKATSQAREDQYLQRMYPGSPNAPSTQEMLQDQYLLPETKTKLVGFANREGAADPAAQVSKANTVDLFQQIQAGKITTEKPIDDAYVQGLTTRQDHDWAIKQFRDQRTAGGETLAQKKKELFEAVKPKIQGLLPATIDQERGMRMFGYVDYVNKQIKAYQDAGKNPLELFDPKNKEFVGSPESIKGFQPPMKDRINDPKGILKPAEVLDITKLPDNDLVAQVRAGKIDYDKGVEEAVRRGLIKITPAAPAQEAPIAR